MKLDRSTTWAIVALVLGVGVLAVALAIFSPWSDAAIVGFVAALGTLAGGVAVQLGKAAAVQQAVESVAAETTDQTKVLKTVERRVNGELDLRMESAARTAAAGVAEEAAEQASARVIAALRREGVIR